MKLKHFLIFFLFLFPLLSQAQIKLDLSISSGFSKTYVVDENAGKYYPLMNEHKLGTSLKGGLDMEYLFNNNISIGVGVHYIQKKSVRYYADTHKMDRISKAISIPISFNYQFKATNFGLLLGAAANINLNKNEPTLFNTYQYENQKLFYSIHAGAYYQMIDHIKLSIIYEADLSPFYSYTYLSTPENHPGQNYLFRSINLKLSYTVFSK